MFDNGGRSVKVVFFKGAYIKALGVRSEGVYIRGRLTKNGSTLYLSNVW